MNICVCMSYDVMYTYISVQLLTRLYTHNTLLYLYVYTCCKVKVLSYQIVHAYYKRLVMDEL